MKTCANKLIGVLLLTIIATVFLSGCGFAPGNTTQIADMADLEFNSLPELAQEATRIAGQQDDAYDMQNLKTIFVPKLFSDDSGGLTCERIAISKNYYLIVFAFNQDSSILSEIKDDQGNHYLLTHISFQVDRELWSSQKFLEDSAKEHPEVYKKIESNGQDYFVGTLIYNQDGVMKDISSTVRWVKNSHQW